MADDTNTVRLCYKNYEFEVTVDTETYEKIINDEVYKEDFARQTYESLENDGHFVLADVKPKINLGFKWTKPAIDLLINLRFGRNDQFNSAKTRKSEQWHNLAVTLSRSYPGVTGEMCDAKYRNLLHTYKLNKQKQNKFGIQNVKWEYFEQFDNALGSKLSSLPQRDSVFFDSLLATDDLDMFTNEELLRLDSPPDSPASGSSPPTSRTRELKLTEYLRIKAENDIRNMKLKARIWREKKNLKEREIAAIIQLAKVMKSKK